jgi:hypothetical protein
MENEITKNTSAGTNGVDIDEDDSSSSSSSSSDAGGDYEAHYNEAKNVSLSYSNNERYRKRRGMIFQPLRKSHKRM